MTPTTHGSSSEVTTEAAHLVTSSSADNEHNFFIRWKGFRTNVVATLERLCFDGGHYEPTADVNLVTSDGIRIRAHKLVLASGSDFLKHLLLDHEVSGQDVAVVMLCNIDSTAVHDLMCYLYRGQVSVGHERLVGLVAAGRALQIKGIMGVSVPPPNSSFQFDCNSPPLAHFQPLPLAQLQQQPQTTPTWPAFAPSISNPLTPPPITTTTGLSLLANAALDSSSAEDHITMSKKAKRRKRMMASNDENSPLCCSSGDSSSSSSSSSAINLSMRPSGGQPFGDLTSSVQTSTSTMPPMASLLTIPDPTALRLKRNASSASGPIVMRDDTPPPLAIDMSASASAASNAMPATPSPSPSSSAPHHHHHQGQSRLSLDSSFSSRETATPVSGIESPLPPLVMPGSPGSAGSSSNNVANANCQEGKKWKSRQPKLCIHCDRYFSNQFNLKQHILNMHTVGGDVRCDKCNKTVKNKWYLRRHHVTHHNAPLKKWQELSASSSSPSSPVHWWKKHLKTEKKHLRNVPKRKKIRWKKERKNRTYL